VHFAGILIRSNADSAVIHVLLRSMESLRVAVVDDDPAFLAILVELARECDTKPVPFSSGKAAQACIEEGKVDAVVTDYRLPGQVGGEEIVRSCREKGIPVAVISAVDSADVALRLVSLGANDYLVKPSTPAELYLRIQTFIERARLERSALALTQAVQSSGAKPGSAILGATPALKPLLSELPRAAQSGANILINGESGTGKELVARAVHELSRRSHGPFIAVDCGAIPESLLENEFFGHKKGAYSDAREDTEGMVQRAHGGTLFLDEVGELPLLMQAKLLRFLQTKEYRRLGDPKTQIADVRIVAATHQDLRSAVREKRYRQDLFFRLNVIRLRLPPLRERLEDIPLLATAFLRKYAELFESPALAFTREAFTFLESRPWEGNVRELENVVQRAVALTRTPMIEASDLREPDHEVEFLASLPPAMNELYIPPDYFLRSYHDAKQAVVDTFETEYAKRALARHDGNVSAAARDAELDRKSLVRLLERQGIGTRTD
jgi:DNA-binding NtrC family response regulator